MGFPLIEEIVSISNDELSPSDEESDFPELEIEDGKRSKSDKANQ